jgi:hypothetical protein
MPVPSGRTKIKGTAAVVTQLEQWKGYGCSPWLAQLWSHLKSISIPLIQPKRRSQTATGDSLPMNRSPIQRLSLVDLLKMMIDATVTHSQKHPDLNTLPTLTYQI